MLVLGIESTCDETGFAVVKNGSQILSNIVASQEDIHEKYGGVVPELASRQHIDVAMPLLDKALKQAETTIKDIDLIAVAYGPGLIGAILVGLNFAKGLSLASGIPFVGVNHVEAHLYSSLMEAKPELPALGVAISGGHTALTFVREVGDYSLIGQTQDDAIGEAFDKTAKLLELPYPGGPAIESIAKEGDEDKYLFKAGQIKHRPYDFSFSGLKTSVFYKVKGQNAQKHSPLLISDQDKKDIAASFQKAAFSDLVEKVVNGAKKYCCKSIIFGGGVSQNKYLRRLMEKSCSIPVFWPSPDLCLDNAAMIAGLGYHQFLNKGADPLTLQPSPRIPFSALSSSSAVF